MTLPQNDPKTSQFSRAADVPPAPPVSNSNAGNPPHLPPVAPAAAIVPPSEPGPLAPVSDRGTITATPVYFSVAPRAASAAHEIRYDTRPWSQLVDALLAAYSFMPHDGTPEGIKAAKLSCPMISPATFIPGASKHEKNVTGVHWLVLDFDDVTTSAFFNVVSRLEAEGIAAFSYSTWSQPQASQLQGADGSIGLVRARVGMPISRPCSPQEWRGVYRAALAKYGATGVDTSCSDPSRFYFVPALPMGSEVFAKTWRAPGLGYVDVDTLVRESGASGASLARAIQGASTDPIPRDALVRLAAKLNRSLKPDELRVGQLMHAGLEGHAFAAMGQRHNAKLSLTMRIAEQFPRGNASQIAEHFRQSLDLMRDGTEREEPLGKFAALIESAQGKIQEGLEQKRLERANDRRRAIPLFSKQLEDIANEAIEELAPLDVFQRSGVLVHVTRDAVADRIVRPAGAPSIRDLPRSRLRELLDRRVRFEQRREDGAIASVAPPYEIVNAIAERGEWPHVRPLKGIVNFPVLRPDGSVLDTPGYDLATATLSNSSVILSVPPLPTQADAQRAARTLLGLVGDFPFQNDAARSVWLAALLTPLARTAIDGPVPLTILDANARGAGKSKLAQLIGRIVLGADLPMRTAPETQEEWRKALFAIVLAGDPLVLIDNVTRMVQSAALDAILTSTRYSDRVLGVSQERSISVRTTFLLSSNNARLSSDLVRRSLQCRLEATEERPEHRKGFRIPNVVAYALEYRAHYLSAALTILRAFVVAGRPEVECQAIGSFESWSRQVAAPLVWLGLPDPVSTQAALREGADVERDEVAALYRAWFGVFPDGRPITARELVDAAEGQGVVVPRFTATGVPIAPASRQALRDALAGLFDGKDGERLPSATKLGYRLRTLRGQIVGGLVLHKHDEKSGDHSTKWAVLPVNSLAA